MISFPSHTCEWNCDIGEVKNESPVKICESKEGLNVLEFAWFGLFLGGLDLVISQRKTSQREHVAKVLHGVGVEIALISAGIQVVFSEASEDLTDTSAVLFHVVQVDKDIIQIDKDAYIEHVGEDVIHEALKSCWCIS